jgi:hypothetical protein
MKSGVSYGVALIESPDAGWAEPESGHQLRPAITTLEAMSHHILKLLRFFKRDEAELRQADTAEVADTAVGLLEQQEREEFVDVDLLISAGRKFRLTGHHSIDAVVESWLTEQPTCRRFDVASSFLSGYWGSNWPIQETLAGQITEQLPLCEPDPNALPSMLVALSQVSRTAASEETKLLVRKVLVSYRSRAVELKLQRGTIQLIDEAVG